MEYLSVEIAGRVVPVCWLSDHDPIVQVRILPGIDPLPPALRDWTGAVVTLADGDRFLEAAFDHLTVQGLHPRWINVGRCGLDPTDLPESETPPEHGLSGQHQS